MSLSCESKKTPRPFQRSFEPKIGPGLAGSSTYQSAIPSDPIDGELPFIRTDITATHSFKLLGLFAQTAPIFPLASGVRRTPDGKIWTSSQKIKKQFKKKDTKKYLHARCKKASSSCPSQSSRGAWRFSWNHVSDWLKRNRSKYPHNILQWYKREETHTKAASQKQRTEFFLLVIQGDEAVDADVKKVWKCQNERNHIHQDFKVIFIHRCRMNLLNFYWYFPIL